MNEAQNIINQNIPDILMRLKNIAIVGLSPKPDKTSYQVGAYIKQAGYNVFPVNPNYDNVMNLKCYNTLKEIPEPVDIVNIFRKSEDVLPVVKEAININAK
ncbi:MAG: CoA-binding protein, partial [Calditrichaceae bacterium]|nr:CoA-binding protein [Calditrichaceae bacterium]